MVQPNAPSGIRGGGVTLFGSGVTLILQFASVVILSRLLTPADFGLVALATVFVTLGNLIRDFGMPMAALQAKSLTHQEASNLFWMNLGLASSAAALLALSTPLLVHLFAEPRLSQLVPALAVVVLINGAGAQIQVDLARRMRFTILAVSDVSAQALALALAVVLASSGFGYWALIAQSMATAIFTLVPRWVASGWAPARFRNEGATPALFRAGAEYGIAYLLTFLQNNADTLIIGARLGSTQLGLYSRGYQLLTAPAGRLLDPLTQVVVTGVNRARSQGLDYIPIILQIQLAIGATIVWGFAMSGALAGVLVPFLLGDGWEQTVGVFQILAIGGCVAVFSHVSYWLFILNEQSSELLRYNLVTKPIAVLSIGIGSFYGIDGVAWGYTIAMCINWPVNLYWLKRTAALPALRFVKNGLIVLLSGTCGALAAGVVDRVIGGQQRALTFGLSLTVGTIVMGAALIAFPTIRHQMRGPLASFSSALQRKWA